MMMMKKMKEDKNYKEHPNKNIFSFLKLNLIIIYTLNNNNNLFSLFSFFH